MTIQMSDSINYEGEAHRTWSFPLEGYYCDHPRPEFGVSHSGLRRGYVATWGVDADTLYLTGIEVRRPDHTIAGLDELFPKQGERIEATWFSGEIRIHGFVEPSGCERDRVLKFVGGRLVRSEVEDPGPSR
jgi:hypothetical protein